jgi:predicted exporter
MATPEQRPLAASLLLLVLCALVAAFCAARWGVRSDISHFLPEGDDSGSAQLLKQLGSSALGQRMVLNLGGADPDRLARASTALAAALRRQPEIARVENGANPDAQRELFDLYFPRRFHLWSEQPETEYPGLLSEAGLQRAASQLLSGLTGPRSALLRPLAARDPLLQFERVIERLDAAREGGLLLRDGVFFTRDGAHAVLFVETAAPLLDSPSQRHVLRQLGLAFEHLRRVHGTGLVLESSGVNRFAIYAEDSIRADVQRISSLSSLGLVALFLVVFRSLRGLIVTSLAPLLAALCATAATLGLFGSVHGATLAFGTILIGVCVDFPVHLFAHHSLGEPGRSARQNLLRVWPALLLAGLTTVAGLLGFGFAAFPGIREMAFFTAVGVTSALLFTRFLVPHLLGPSGRSHASTRRLAQRVAVLTARLRARPLVSWLLLITAVGLCVGGLPALRFTDDLAAWVPAPAGLRAEDARVRQRTMATDAARMVVTTGPDLEATLAGNDRLAESLAASVAAGEIGGFQSLHSLLWSGALQRRNLNALARGSASIARVPGVFAGAGFQDDAFAAFATEASAPGEPLGLSELASSVLGPLMSAFVIDAQQRPTVVTYLREVHDRTALERRLHELPRTRYFDQPAFLRDTYRSFRTRALELIGLGLLGVFGMVLVRHRALRPTCAAVVPAILASGGALSLLALLGVTLDLFHVVGLLLVLSMGEDYGVFLVENSDPENLPATMLGLLVACASTVLSFGLLAMSNIPALRSLGQVISVGVTLALLWAPAGLVLLQRSADARGGHG